MLLPPGRATVPQASSAPCAPATRRGSCRLRPWEGSLGEWAPLPARRAAPPIPSLPAGQGCISAPDWLLWGLGRVRAVAGHALELEPRGKGQRDHHGQVPAVIVPGLGATKGSAEGWGWGERAAAGRALVAGATPATRGPTQRRTVPRYMVIRQVTQMYARHTSWLCSSAASRPLRPLEWSPEEVPWGLLICCPQVLRCLPDSRGELLCYAGG